MCDYYYYTLFVNNHRATEDNKYNFGFFCSVNRHTIVNIVVPTYRGEFFYRKNKHYMSWMYFNFLFLDDRDENYILYNGDLDDTIIILCIHPKLNSHTL